MIAAIGAILPVVLVVMVGTFVRRGGLLDDHQLRGFEKLAYYIFFPAVIIQSLISVDLGNAGDVQIGVVLAVATVIMITAMFALRRPLSGLLGIDARSYTSVFQGAIRWNFFVGLAIANAYTGPTGSAYLAIALVAMAPLVNISSVVMLSNHASGDRPNAAKLARTLISNPLIWSSLVGLILNVSAIDLPDVLIGGLEILGRGALAGGLIAVGAGLEISALKRPTASAWTSVALKQIAMPLLVFGLATLAGITGTALQIAVIAGAVPAATGSYVLARQMGGDAPLMAQILTLQTILSILLLPAAFTLLS